MPIIPKIKRIETIRFIVIAGFASSVIFHYVAGTYFGYGYPYATFLYNPADRFNDFFNIYNSTIYLDPYAKAISVYFPFAYMPIYLLTSFRPSVAYTLFAGLFWLFLIVAMLKQVPVENIPNRLLTLLSLSVLSYPVLFAIDRGNLECLVFIALGLFLHCYATNRENCAALFLACAIAMKLYPGIFVVLFLSDRKWKPILLTLVFTVMLTIGSAFLLAGGVRGSLAGMQKNLLIFKIQYIDTLHGLQHSSSFFVPAKLLAELVGFAELIPTLYPIGALLLFVLTSAWVIFNERELWKKVAILSFMMILLPQVSYDYKLIHTLFPLLLFTGSMSQSRFDAVYSVLFGLLLIPKDYYYLIGDISINGTINALLMVAFLGYIVADRPLVTEDYWATPSLRIR